MIVAVALMLLAQTQDLATQTSQQSTSVTGAWAAPMPGPMQANIQRNLGQNKPPEAACSKDGTAAVAGAPLAFGEACKPKPTTASLPAFGKPPAQPETEKAKNP